MDYNDIIDLPYPTSSRHPRMSMEARAAQFAPFAALTGHRAVLDETARLTDQQTEVDEETARILNEQMRLLRDRLSSKPHVTISYFEHDAHKSGGAYRTMEGHVAKMDDYEHLLILTDGRKINIPDILAIEFNS